MSTAEQPSSTSVVTEATVGYSICILPLKAKGPLNSDPRQVRGSGPYTFNSVRTASAVPHSYTYPT